MQNQLLQDSLSKIDLTQYDHLIITLSSRDESILNENIFKREIVKYCLDHFKMKVFFEQ